MRCHVHIYLIKGLLEINIDADSIKDAEAEALKIAKGKSGDWFYDADCKFIALGFEGEHASNKENKKAVVRKLSMSEYMKKEKG